MKTLKRSTTVLFLALLVANPAYAEFQGCPNPTAETRALLDQCSDSALCRATVSATRGCTSLVNAISSFFRKPPLDPGEYKSERYAPPGSSELEQARKDNELYQQNKSLREYEAKQAYLNLRVSDKSIKNRIGSYCGDPLDQGCKDAVHDAELLAYKFNTYNSNPDFVALRGKLTAESPGIAAPYAKVQEKAWEDTQKMKEAHNKNMREMDEKGQKSPGAGKNSDSGAIQRNLAVVEQEERERIRATAVAEQERLAREQRERNRLAAQQQAQKSAQDEEQRARARQQPVSVASRSGANPTPNQLLAYCEAEWNRYTNNGYNDVTGWNFANRALHASSDDLRSGSRGAWAHPPVYGGNDVNDSPARRSFADCASRGVLAGRNGTFRTPSMIVKEIVDSNTKGRQD